MTRLALLALLVGCAAAPPERVELEASIDGVANSIRIERGVIEALEPIEKQVEAVAAAGRFALWEEPEPPSAEALVALLAEGYTSMALADQPLAESLAIREYVGTGRGRGPRIFVSGPELSRTVPADATELRYRVRIQDAAAAGAEFVVIDAAAGRSVVCAVVEEARRQKVLVWIRGGGPELAPLQQQCMATAVWVHDSETRVPSRAQTSGVWITKALHPVPSDPPTLAHFNSPAAAGAAEALNVDDAIGRVATGYRGDLLISGADRRRVFLDGVEQSPNAPWYADWALSYARWQVRLSPAD